MAVARMKKVTIVGHRSVMDQVVSGLQDMGCVQIVDLRDQVSSDDVGAFAAGSLDQAREGRGDVESRLSRVTYCLNYLSRFETNQKGLIDSFMEQKESIPASRFARVIREFDDTTLYGVCVEDEQAATEARTERARLENLRTMLSGWLGLDIPVEQLGEGRDVCAVAASCSAPDFAGLTEAMRDRPVHLQKVGESGNSIRFIAFYLPGDESVSAEFAARGVSRVSFGDVKGTPKAIAEGIVSRLAEIAEQEQQIVERAMRLLANRVDLWILSDHLSGLRAKEQVKRGFAETGAAFALEGWTKEHSVPAIRERLRGISDAVEMLVEDPGPGDDVPVSLENHPWIQPFEIITNIYGSPKYGEQDPTPLLAPFFFVFFGLALTDAAYGILLAFGSWYLMKKYRIPRDGRRFFHLMIYGGISTTIFGAMAGGWFGNLVDFAPQSMAFLRRFRDAFFVFDPMTEPLKFMILALALGVIQVWFGILVKMVATIKSGAWLDAIYDQLTWLVFLPSLVMMAVTGAGIAAGLSGAASRLALLTALAIVITQGRHTKNILLKPFSGLYALYGTVGYFSDVLSYTRLLALGLATGVIGNVVNQIAQLVKMIPFASWVLVPLVLAGGHAFNLLINVLGAFIHSGRLQFVEFFTKFFEGGGRAFAPFRKDTKYVMIE
ncbi:MAG: V-type ATP synthase subunit I [Firmicutes bacterium]|nr:V-type ATP synthase subunit I [Bacillota bacterium]